MPEMNILLRFRIGTGLRLEQIIKGLLFLRVHEKRNQGIPVGDLRGNLFGDHRDFCPDDLPAGA